MAIWVCLALWCLISSNSIYYAPKSDVQVKSYDYMNFSRASVVQFRVSRYIVCLNRTSELKDMAGWICLALSILISSISIYYAPESDIWKKSYDHLNFLRASIVEFQASRYNIGLNRTSKSKVMAIWIFRTLPSLISSIMIYYVLESDIWVKSYDYTNFSRAFVVHFQAYPYIIGLNRTFESKDMAVCISLAISFLISYISIYYAPESDIRMKIYDHLNFSRAFVVQFQASQYIIGLNRTSKWKVMTIWISREFSWFNFDRLDILLAWIRHLSQ